MDRIHFLRIDHDSSNKTISIARKNMCLDRDKSIQARARSMRLLHSSIWLVLLFVLQETPCCRAWTTTASCWRTRTSTAFGRNTVTFLSLDDSLPDDQDMEIPHPRELQQSMNDLFSINKKAPINQDPAGGYTLTDLEDYFSQRTPGSKSPARPIPKLNASLEEIFPSESSDGMYLDPDLYVKSSQWLNPDGSLNFPNDEERLKPGQTGPDYQRILKAIVQPAPNSPDSVAPNSGIQSMEEVWQALQQQASTTTKNSNVTATSEELHRQVFAEEQGYLQQSQIFREALTDSSKAAEAATLRHGQQFRQRQAEAIASLDEQIKEWEEGWEENYTQAQHCSKCECILAHDEIEISRKHQGLCQVCYADVLVAKSKQNPPPPVPRQPVLRRLKTGGTFRPRSAEPTPDGESVQFREPNMEDDPVESFRSDRAPETLASEQSAGPPSERVERTAGSSQLPPVTVESFRSDRSPEMSAPEQSMGPPSERVERTAGSSQSLPVTVESFRSDRSPEMPAREQSTGPPSERVERTVGSSQSPPVTQDPTKWPRNLHQRLIRPTRPPDPIPVDPVRQNDSNEDSLDKALQAEKNAEAKRQILPRPTEPAPDGGTVQRREPKMENEPVESFCSDRAPKFSAPEQSTGPSSERVERTAGSSRSPPVSQDPAKPPRNLPQRPIRPTRLPHSIPVDPVRQNDSNGNSLDKAKALQAGKNAEAKRQSERLQYEQDIELIQQWVAKLPKPKVTPPAKQSDNSQPSVPFFAAETKMPPPSKDTNDANAVDDE